MNPRRDSEEDQDAEQILRQIEQTEGGGTVTAPATPRPTGMYSTGRPTPSGPTATTTGPNKPSAQGTMSLTIRHLGRSGRLAAP